jgi:ubiquinone/menaquinone biosynthesis C-methylase UbiE
MKMTGVLSHNEGATAVWGSGGRDYDRICEHVADALAHVVNRLLPEPNERISDVATGTGWTARVLASRGARVTGVDIGAGVIEAAKGMAPAIDFRVGDAENLPFRDCGHRCFGSAGAAVSILRIASPSHLYGDPVARGRSGQV